MEYKERVNNFIEIIGEVTLGDLHKRLPEQGNDELSLLAFGINRMLDNLESLIAELQKKNKQLEEMQQQLVMNAKLAAAGRVAAEIAHELRNPLSVIMVASSYLLENTHNSPKRTMLERVLSSVKKAEGFINDLLLVTHKDMKLTIEKVNVEAAIMDSVAQMPKQPTNIDIKYRISPNLYITADANRIKQVFLNLISNACEAMPNGGNLVISATEQDDHIIIDFTDTGEGISEENLPYLFNPFFTTKKDGIGLGLSLSKRIIEFHGGQISAKSIQGKGSTFTVKLKKAT